MEHKNVRISDAIPQRPASFDNAVEQTLARVCQKEQKQEQQKETPVRAWKTETGTERKRRSWRTVLGGVAIASLVVLCVGAIGMTIALRLRSNKSDPAKENPVITPEPTQEPTPEPSQKPVKIGKSYYLVNNVPVYPYESLLWESGSEYNVDGQSIEYKLAEEETREKIPEAEYGAGLNFEILVQDGWTLDEIAVFSDTFERIATVGRKELPLTEHGCANPDCVTTLSPGVYYVSALVESRDEQFSRGNEIVIRLLVREADDTPEPIKDPPEQQSSAIPSVFRFWDYDEENGYREAPERGVLFRCDFDGDGTEEDMYYERHGQYVAISVGDASIDVDVAAGAEQAILLDLDPDSARLNLLVIYNTGSEDYETAELHMKKGRFVRGPVIYAYCNIDDGILRGSATQTDILGTRFGARTYHGEDLMPDAEWFDCDVIPDYIPTASDREHLIENGKLLHVVRDLPCTIDGADAVIPADTYVYMTRWHESGTLAEICTEDGTITALVTVQKADPDDPEQYGYLIGGETQDTYFDNIFYAD